MILKTHWNNSYFPATIAFNCITKLHWKEVHSNLHTLLSFMILFVLIYHCCLPICFTYKRRSNSPPPGHFNPWQHFLFADHSCTLDFCIVILCNNVKGKHSEACLITLRSIFFPLQFSTPLNLKIIEQFFNLVGGIRFSSKGVFVF